MAQLSVHIVLSFLTLEAIIDLGQFMVRMKYWALSRRRVPVEEKSMLGSLWAN